MDEFIMKFNEIWETVKNLDCNLIKVIMCMVMEEVCKRDGADMVETMEELLDVARSVNAEYGKY